MIIRIFRVQVPRSLHQEFEQQFIAISVPYVQKFPWLISVFLGKPIVEDSEEYLMITHWKSLQTLQDFAGKKWQQAVIPEGMEKYVQECWVHHYQSFEH